MGDLINGRTPEHIKRILAWRSVNCAELECDKCQNEDICSPANGNEEAMARDALALIERLEAERDAALAKVPKWISVEERLPDTTDVYLIHTVHRYNKNDGYRCMDVRLFFKGEFEPWQGLPDIYEVTHWMPLPEPPKEK